MSEAVSVTIKPTIPELVKSFVRAGVNLNTDLGERMDKVGKLMVGAMQQEAPKRTGEFAARITYTLRRQGTQYTAEVGFPQPLGKWIIEGTAPHRIEARNAPVLSFFWPKVGRRAAFRYVNHPGTKPNPFHMRAYMRIAPQLEPELKQLAKNFVTDIQP